MGRMFTFIVKKLRFLMQKKREKQNKAVAEALRSGEDVKLSKSLQNNLSLIKEIFGESSDFKTRRFKIGADKSVDGAIVFIDGLVDSMLLSQSILKPLIGQACAGQNGGEITIKSVDDIQSSLLYSGEVKSEESLSAVIDGCLSGNTVVLAEGLAKAIIVNTKGWQKRTVAESQTESVVRGPREGFTEDFRTNTSLLRRRIKVPEFRMETLVIGTRTRTNIAIAYIKGVANEQVVETVKYRLSNIDVDSINDSSYIEQYIEDSPFSLLPTVGYSEKPDVVAARVLEGRVAIIVEGSPFVLTAPMLFIESLQTAEDYYSRTIYASLTRLMRYLAFLIAIFAPALFIALVAFHQELIPTKLLLTIAKAREGTPFPAFLEAFVLVFALEILREAGLRLPRPVGQAVSIVGALIMGEAAVSAGIVGAPMVIIVAITAVASFAVPTLSEPISVLRVVSMVAAAVLGGFGVTMAFLAMLVHIAHLKSFGIPYSMGLSPCHGQSMKDVYIRAPLWSMTKRPKGIAGGDVVRRRFFVPPAQPPETGDTSAKENMQ